jgi:hypothetical protein
VSMEIDLHDRRQQRPTLNAQRPTLNSDRLDSWIVFLLAIANSSDGSTI